MEDINLDYIVISETKLDGCFHNAQFNLMEFEIIAAKDPLFLKD